MSSIVPNGQSAIQIVNVNGNDSIPPMLVNSYSALSIPAYRRAMAFLADNLASFPRSVRKDGAKLNEPHPLDRLLKRRPNSLQNSMVFWRTWFFHAAHTGNGYARIIRNTRTYQPISLVNMLPDNITPFRWDAGDGSGPQQFYLDRVINIAIPGADVLHLQSFSYDGQTGTDPVALHDQTLQRAGMIERYQVQYLRKGTVLRGAIEVPAPMTPDQLNQMKTVLRQFQGVGNRDDLMILSDGAKLNNSTVSPQASQLVEQVAQTTKQISQITGVPPEFLYEMTEAKYNQAIQMAGENVVRYCLRPWIKLAEDELTLKLLPDQEQDQGYTIKLNPDALLRGDTKTQTETLAASINAGIRTPNEARELLDLPPLSDPEADKIKRSGDTSPSDPSSKPPATHSSNHRADVFSQLKPILDAACQRVEAKTEKAFANAEKTGKNMTIWSNVFAEEQARYVTDALEPINQALTSFGADLLDINSISTRYAASIRKRAATGEVTALSDVIHTQGAKPDSM